MFIVNVFSLRFFCSTSVHLLQRLQELKKREHAAKLYNKQLLQQFEEAHDTLRGMITSTAAMKTIRVNRHTEKKQEDAVKVVEEAWLSAGSSLWLTPSP